MNGFRMSHWRERLSMRVNDTSNTSKTGSNIVTVKSGAAAPSGRDAYFASGMDVYFADGLDAYFASDPYHRERRDRS
jgi:hypothetical protein